MGCSSSAKAVQTREYVDEEISAYNRQLASSVHEVISLQTSDRAGSSLAPPHAAASSLEPRTGAPTASDAAFEKDTGDIKIQLNSSLPTPWPSPTIACSSSQNIKLAREMGSEASGETFRSWDFQVRS
ncbi:unnamed protein product [Polarella glacialis]|uniref:Uncharacterized protein n=1 Tax=Polarella glacialis TaxID=89957 RepID=A0A813F096_POLGL|nr:unnamed protein product [Polarella glacialis]